MPTTHRTFAEEPLGRSRGSRSSYLVGYTPPDMAVHLLHIRKSGGTAIKFALNQAAKRAGEEQLTTAYGPIIRHPHAFRLGDVPEGEFAIFSLRDPATRFVSGFYSRLRKGAPRYNRPWSEDETKCFEWFSTPQELAHALAQGDGEDRDRAEFAMNSIRHLKFPLIWWTGEAQKLWRRLPHVLYIARQETLTDDWERLKVLFDIPKDIELPDDDKKAHRLTGNVDKSLTPEMLEALRDWYAADYELLELCESARGEMIASLQRLADSLEPYAPKVPPKPKAVRPGRARLFLSR